MAEIILFGIVLLGVASTFCAYRLGINDGYNAGRYPGHPGYAKAERWLKKTGQWKEPVTESAKIATHYIKTHNYNPRNYRKG